MKTKGDTQHVCLVYSIFVAIQIPSVYLNEVNELSYLVIHVLEIFILLYING